MKILESQNAVLSNYEVYQHLMDRERMLKEKRRRGPGNLATLVKEVLAYLKTPPSPLVNQEKTHQYTADVVPRLMARLNEANLNQDLAKSEILMILNIRPSSIAVLSTVIEDMEERFNDDEQQAILDAISEALGHDEPAGGEEIKGDAAENGTS